MTFYNENRGKLIVKCDKCGTDITNRTITNRIHVCFACKHERQRIYDKTIRKKSNAHLTIIK
jgi:hypothetical protein